MFLHSVRCWTDPLYGREGILYAELDMAEIAQSKYDFDVTGHYARPDVFQLRINEKPLAPVTYDSSDLQ